MSVWLLSPVELAPEQGGVCVSPGSRTGHGGVCVSPPSATKPNDRVNPTTAASFASFFMLSPKFGNEVFSLSKEANERRKNGVVFQQVSTRVGFLTQEFYHYDRKDFFKQC